MMEMMTMTSDSAPLVTIYVSKTPGKCSRMYFGESGACYYPTLNPEWSDDMILSKLFWQKIPAESVKIIRSDE